MNKLLFLLLFSSQMSVDTLEAKIDTVRLTIYKPLVGKTDSTPNITASGFKIDLKNPKKHKIVAVSRDLKRDGWSFGKKIKIEGAGKLDGIYTIQDVMNKRYTKKIDVLVGYKHPPVKYSNIKITLLNSKLD